MREMILKQNPWWEGKKDFHIEKWEKMRIRWVPKWIDSLSLSPFSLNFIIGARQTGKTTGIKLLINKLIEKERKEAVFYFDCTILTNFKDLKRVIDEYLEIKKVEKIENSFIFLDEISNVEEWWRVIKSYIDMGIFKNDVLTVSGSSSLQLKKHAELFPGRRGNGKNIKVFPLSFREFLEINGIKLDFSNNFEENMKKTWKKEREIKELFKVYLEKGGYPLSINDYPEASTEIISSIQSEILKAGKSIELSKEIIGSILRKSPSPLSFSTIGNDIGISYKTVQEYVETFKNLFLMGIALFKEKNVKWRKERKFFFLDPFLARSLASWVGEKFLDSALYEWVVQSHLMRKFENIYYYRNSYEIDCLAGNLKIEVKAGKPHRKYPKNVIVLDEENLPLFLASIV